jgi:hypothetical protein
MRGEELKTLHSSPNIIRVIKSSGIRQTHVACMQKMRNALSSYKILVKNSKGKSPLRDLVIHQKIILN